MHGWIDDASNDANCNCSEFRNETLKKSNE